MTDSVESSLSVVSSNEIETELVPSPVDYRVLRPPPSVVDTEGVPLLVLLHGGGGAADFLDTLQPLFDRLWADRALPAMLVATPSAGRSFYLDRLDGSQLWEQFLLSQFIPQLIEETGAGRGGEAVALVGISMGGLGLCASRSSIRIVS